MSGARPFKVWNADRSVKKSVTASTLQELLSKGKEKLHFMEQENARVVLEEDGTEVDEEDYFAFLPYNTTVIVLRAGETWRPEGSEVQGKDEPDFMTEEGKYISDRLQNLAKSLQRDITRIIALSNDDLQGLADLSVSDLAQLLGDTESYASAVKESCQRHLDERQQTSEAMDLLRLYHKARQHSPYVGDEEGEGDGAKRQKFAQT